MLHRDQVDLETLVESFTPDQRPKILSVRRCPVGIMRTVTYLKTKHRNLQTNARTFQLLSMAGVWVVKEVAGDVDMRRRWREAYERGDEARLVMYSLYKYNLSNDLMVDTRRVNVYMNEQVCSDVYNLAYELDVSVYVVAVVVLLGGMMRSGKWVPQGYRDVARGEVERFGKWLEKKRELV